MNDFFANWYESLAYFDNFSDDLYNQNLYITIGLCMVLIPVIFMSIYYFVVNSVKLNKWYHWLILAVILGVINFCIAYFCSFNDLSFIYEQQNKELPYSSEFVGFSLINVLWSLVVTFVYSMIIKWSSKNCRRTPF